MFVHEMMYEVNKSMWYGFYGTFPCDFRDWFHAKLGGCLLESVVDENDFCFVCLIGEKFSVARKWSFCCVLSAGCVFS